MPIPPFQEVHIENTNSCGYKCVMCPRESHTRRIGFMSTDDFAFLLERTAPFQGIFHLHAIPHAVSPLIVVELKEAAHLGGVLSALLAAEVNIYGSYALLTRPNDNPTLALHVEDYDCGTSVLKAGGFSLLDQADISR